MSRYIDADAVCELLEPFTDAFDDMEVTSAYVQTLSLISNAPSIDIVRCAECKHGEYWDGFNEYECHANKYAIRHKPDFYCADGERREP